MLMKVFRYIFDALSCAHGRKDRYGACLASLAQQYIVSRLHALIYIAYSTQTSTPDRGHFSNTSYRQITAYSDLCSPGRHTPPYSVSSHAYASCWTSTSSSSPPPSLPAPDPSRFHSERGSTSAAPRPQPTWRRRWLRRGPRAGAARGVRRWGRGRNLHCR